MSTVTIDDLISPEYQAQLELLRSHNYKPQWGPGGKRHADAVCALIDEHKVESVVDYGCGAGQLIEELLSRRLKSHPWCFGFDPGISKYATLPPQVDMVVSTDVLEHIEPDKLDGVLTHIRFLTGKVAYLNIHTQAANTKLPDGRNAHLIQKPLAWWQNKLGEYFSDVKYAGGGVIRPSFVCA